MDKKNADEATVDDFNEFTIKYILKFKYSTSAQN